MRNSSQCWMRCACLGLALMLLSGPRDASAISDEAFVVYPEFQNALDNTATNLASQNSLALFSGHLGGYSPPGSEEIPVVPVSAQGVQMAASAFGQMLARDVPHPDFVNETIQMAQARLYPPESANTRELIFGSGAAFRYKELLYSNTVAGARAGFESIADYFGEPERQLAREGIEILRQALKYAPLNRRLRNALLDAYYDWIVAEAQHVKNDLSLVAKYRLGLATLPQGTFIIDKEIEGYEGVIENYGYILDEYGKLFVDHGGIDVSQIDSDAPPGMVFGQWVFQQEQPYRNQFAAQFRDVDGTLRTFELLPDGMTTDVPVNQNPASSMLFAGYKDYVALLGLMSDYALSATELAKLYGMRGRTEDKTLGFELIEDVNTEVLLNSSLLHALLPNALPPESELDASGARAAQSTLLASTAELTKIGSFLNSQVNVLGFDPDFLALISTFEDQNQEQLWDSYDALRGWLNSGGESSILGRARAAFESAQLNFDTYQARADQVFNELDANEDTYAERYREITGYFPEEPPDPYPSPAPPERFPPVNTNLPPTHVNNPRANSELSQVYRSIEQSNGKEESLDTSQSILQDQIMQARKRLQNATIRTDLINDATENYQGTIRTQRDIMRDWNSAQAAAQAAYDMISDVASLSKEGLLFGGGFAAGAILVAGAANIAVQTIGELKKGNAEKQLDLAAADFERNLALADTDQNIFQAGEEQRNLDREQQSLVLTMLDNQFVRNQDLERAEGLKRELQQALVSREQNNSDLAGRYYADPIHYLRAQNSMLRADFTFRSAQRWVFFLLRALEYKYNQPFVYTEPTPGSPRWDSGSVFRVRNALELDDLVNAMHLYNLANLGKLNGRTIVTDQISMKDDVWGAHAEDPQTVFQNRMTASFDTARGVYIIKLNTLRLSEELDNGSLFIGAEYGLDGSLTSAGFYLDKIEWIKVKFVDSVASSQIIKQGDLSYGGTTFDRPELALPLYPGFSNTNELRSFPFRSFKMGTDANGVLRATSTAEQRATMNVVFWNQPDKGVEPVATIPGDYQSTFLRERSVAMTDLSLTISADKVNLATLRDIHIYIRHRFALRDVQR